jgi:predicted translin family RNA/ssDNA-binding protein
VEKQRREIEEESKKRLDKEAIAAIEQTQKAVEAIGRGQLEKARAAIAEATAKVNNLLARNPANVLMPVDSELRVIDIAPREIQAILEIAQDASRALDEKNCPAARALLHSLMSEIRVRTYNLPLAIYPDTLNQAARLLDQKDTEKANTAFVDGDIHHRAGQVVGPNHLIGEQYPKHRVDPAQQAIAEVTSTTRAFRNQYRYSQQGHQSVVEARNALLVSATE